MDGVVGKIRLISCGGPKLNGWLEAARDSLVGFFANGAKKDFAAVRNVIIISWSKKCSDFRDGVASAIVAISGQGRELISLRQRAS